MPSYTKELDHIAAAVDLVIEEKNLYKAIVERQDERIAKLERMLEIKGLIISDN